VREIADVDLAGLDDDIGEDWRRVYKRYLSGHQLADELGGQTLLDGTWFSAAQSGGLGRR
jgi:hypothetical protein